VTPDEIASVDAKLASWCQGDVALVDAWPSIHLADLAVPGSREAEQLAEIRDAEGDPLGLEVVTSDFPGFMIVSQTCDIVRSCAQREFVELCPLVKIPGDKLPQVIAGRMARYLYCSGLSGRPLAADLERVATIEKALLVQYTEQRISGAASHSERRRIASALGRKRSRAAFPNDFVTYIGPLHQRIVKQHGKQSAEGNFLRAAREMRILAQPDWSAEQVEVAIFVLFEKIDEITDDADAQLEALIKRLPKNEKYTAAGYIKSLDQISAATYIASEALDLDSLSNAS
jgi:hypothetical protein